MNILFLAPHPFYQERGTPIAVDLLLSALSGRGDTIDLITYGEGEDRAYPGVSIHRISPPFQVHNVRPGFSLKKLYCDWFIFLKQLKMMRRTRYDLVHAVEESSFLAVLTAMMFKVPFVYDMDSLLSSQLADKYAFLRPFQPLLRLIEGVPMRKAVRVIPMCTALEERARELGAKNTFVLSDISLLGTGGQQETSESIRADLAIDGMVVMYIGNFEKYQGLQLLLEAFGRSDIEENRAHLVCIGGTPSDIKLYESISVKSGIGSNVHFLGKRPPSHLGAYLAQADIVASPRIAGENTPMKIYSYLDSGKPVIATRLRTHTQVIEENMALLVEPDVHSFADGLNRLYKESELRDSLARHAKKKVTEMYTVEHFEKAVHELFSKIESEIDGVGRR